MKTPIDIIKGKIVDYDGKTGVMTIKAVYPDWQMLYKREYSDCLIQLVDGRPLSTKQRNTCYKLIRMISEFTGNGVDPTKERLKEMFIHDELQAENIDEFSLSDAPMSLVCAFQRYLVRFMLDYDIPSSIPLLELADDTQDYIYNCLVHKRCCICGQPSDLHHIDRVGTGRNRKEIIHEGLEVLPLCRVHHTEAHDIGQYSFEQKYHIDKGVILDKNLCRIYSLKRKEELEYAKSHRTDGAFDT